MLLDTWLSDACGPFSTAGLSMLACSPRCVLCGHRRIAKYLVFNAQKRTTSIRNYDDSNYDFTCSIKIQGLMTVIGYEAHKMSTDVTYDCRSLLDSHVLVVSASKCCGRRLVKRLHSLDIG
jgi:hypothetical protein